MSKHLSVDIRVPIEADNPAIRRIESLCIQCGQCRDVCQQQISVGKHYDLAKTNDYAIVFIVDNVPMYVQQDLFMKYKTS
ncbi:MAG: 4Fe-4S binding protein [Longicatena sp.]